MTAPAIAGKKARIDLFDLDATLRSLGRRLMESDGLPIDCPASLLRDKDRIREDEHAFLMGLVIGHYRRHEIGSTPSADVHPCPNGAAPCKNLGLARALMRGCMALRDRRQMQHVQDLRDVIAETDLTLTKLSDEITRYLSTCETLHRTAWKGIPPAAQQRESKVRIHIHDDVCVMPQRLGDWARKFRRGLAMLDAVSLVPQYASKDIAANKPGQRRRPLLVAAMQADLMADGWDVGDAAEIVDDNLGGGWDVVKDRVRKRVASYLRAQQTGRTPTATEPTEERTDGQSPASDAAADAGKPRGR